MNIDKSRKSFIRYELTEQDLATVKLYLNGDFSSRQAAEKLGISHQQVINLVSSLARDWFRKGLIKI